MLRAMTDATSLCVIRTPDANTEDKGIRTCELMINKLPAYEQALSGFEEGNPMLAVFLWPLPAQQLSARFMLGTTGFVVHFTSALLGMAPVAFRPQMCPVVSANRDLLELLCLAAWCGSVIGALDIA